MRKGKRATGLNARGLKALVIAARELDAALDESREKQTCIWLEPISSDRVYKARCALAEALDRFPSHPTPGPVGR